jgi:hypothetical protein
MMKRECSYLILGIEESREKASISNTGRVPSPKETAKMRHY